MKPVATGKLNQDCKRRKPRPMKAPLRYITAIAINFVVPWLAYLLTTRLYGPTWTLAASAVPLAAWMLINLVRFGHLDALTAQALVSPVLSLAIIFLTGESRNRMIEEPIGSGLVGCCFLLSLLSKRPISFYRARSLMERKSSDGATHIEAMWNTRPEWRAQIRFMAIVWGIALISENMARFLLVWRCPDGHDTILTSQLVQYASYGILTIWSIWYRSARLRRKTTDRVGAPSSSETVPPRETRISIDELPQNLACVPQFALRR